MTETHVFLATLFAFALGGLVGSVAGLPHHQQPRDLQAERAERAAYELMGSRCNCATE